MYCNVLVILGLRLELILHKNNIAITTIVHTLWIGFNSLGLEGKNIKYQKITTHVVRMTFKQMNFKNKTILILDFKFIVHQAIFI
jgi:hypothetical protein